MFFLQEQKKLLTRPEPSLQRNFWFFKMEPSSKIVENISFDNIKKGLVDALNNALDKINLLESDQKNLYQGRG